jgi:hypothetical protein
VVNRGGFAVKAWQKNDSKSAVRDMPTFARFFDFFATIDGADAR